MPESPVFGRHRQPAARGARVSTLADEAGRNLGHFADRILGGGGLIAFGGLLLLFVATQVWPPDAASLGVLGGTIYVPASLKEALAAMQPPFAVHTARMVVHSVGIDLINPAVALLALAGLGASFRRRWWLAGLTAAFFAFPWALIGYHIVGAPVVLTLLAGAALYGIYRPRLWVAIAGTLFAVFVLQALLPVSQLVGRLTFADTVKVTYQTIRFADLKQAEETDGGPRTAVLAGIPVSDPVQSAAKSYVVAQELALSGNAAGALAAVKDAEAQGFAATVFDQRRVAAIERYATASGVIGDAAKSAAGASDRMGRMLATALAAIGIVLALFGPISDIIGRRLLKRVARLDKAKSRLETQYATIARGEAGATGGEADTIRSIAVLDGQAVMAAIAGRVRLYRRAVVTLAVMMAGFLLGAVWLWLPAASDNTAFAMLSLPPQLAAMARDAGLVAPGDRPDLASFYASTLAALAPIIGVYLLVRRRRLAPVGLMLIAYSVIQIAGLSPIRHSFTEVAPAAVGEDMIATWRNGLDNPDEADAPDTLHGSEAAYGLAQLAYLAGQPTDTRSYLDKIRDTKLLGGVVHRQKIELMHEWTAAHGFAVAPDSAAASLPASMAPTRLLSRAGLGLGFFSAILALLAAAAGVIAGRRQRRIDALVTARAVADMPLSRRHMAVGNTMPHAAG